MPTAQNRLRSLAYPEPTESRKEWGRSDTSAMLMTAFVLDSTVSISFTTFQTFLYNTSITTSSYWDAKDIVPGSTFR